MPDKEKTYPTEPNAKGYFFASKEEEEQNILTKEYKNGSAIKELELSNGAKAVVRKLKGRDFVETKKRVQTDKGTDFETANMAVATEIDGKQQPPEYYLDDLYQSDYAKVMIAYAGLNFQ